MHFDPSSCCQISVFFHTSISFWTWHCNPHSTPKQRLRLWNLHISVFAMFSFHSLILFRFCTKKNPCRRGLTTWRTSQVMAPDLPLWAPLRSILGQKLSGNLRAQSLCVSPQKCHPFWCVKRFKLWFMRLCMSMHVIFDSEVHMSNNINNTWTQRKLSLPIFHTFFVASRQQTLQSCKDADGYPTPKSQTLKPDLSAFRKRDLIDK